MKNYFVLFLLTLTVQCTLEGAKKSELTDSQKTIAQEFFSEITKQDSSGKGTANIKTLEKCMEKYPEVVRLGKLNNNKNTQPFLVYAILHKQPLDVIKVMVEHASVQNFEIISSQDSLKQNGLHYAVMENRADLIEYFLIFDGIDIQKALEQKNTLNGKTETPLELAQRLNHQNIATLLENKEANLNPFLKHKNKSPRIKPLLPTLTGLTTLISFAYDYRTFKNKTSKNKEEKEKLSYFAHLKKHPRKHAGFFVGLVAGLATVAQLIPKKQPVEMIE